MPNIFIAVAVVVALYLIVFVLVARFFAKVPALKALAPTQSEPQFLLTHAGVMLVFIVLGIFATRNSRRRSFVRRNLGLAA
jgi:lysylphosphatidylglycerol synthetase-like protein (DUF2156 family)